MSRALVSFKYIQICYLKYLKYHYDNTKIQSSNSLLGTHILFLGKKIISKENILFSEIKRTQNWEILYKMLIHSLCSVYNFLLFVSDASDFRFK